MPENYVRQRLRVAEVNNMRRQACNTELRKWNRQATFCCNYGRSHKFTPAFGFTWWNVRLYVTANDRWSSARTISLYCYNIIFHWRSAENVFSCDARMEADLKFYSSPCGVNR